MNSTANTVMNTPGATQYARLVIFRSETGRGGWGPVRPEDVPDFVRRADVMGRLVAGEMCCDVGAGDKGSAWYMANPIETAH